MFQRLDQLRTGTLYIVTGQAGAGKSHLAASTRRSGAVWIIDTEGASQNLLNKSGIHHDVRAVQTLSLRQLMDALREVRRAGKPGDTVILDSISKVLQAMRSHAQQRAGAETDRKASLSYDEHASINRNLQAIYTGLTELKHAGFHVVIIGHLAKKYQTNGGSLSDVGLRVLADDKITYEADAILLVERNGTRRTITPIIKPPRQRHLQINQEYPATLATLYPDEAIEPNDGHSAVSTDQPANITSFPDSPHVPKTAREAERRFFARYGDLINGTTWEAVEAFLGYESPKPSTVEEWIEVAAEVRANSGDGAEAVA
jgi:adenosyl cobinamide kinase/adenosyl cobinamide phosphate guanylyltransferase